MRGEPIAGIGDFDWFSNLLEISAALCTEARLSGADKSGFYSQYLLEANPDIEEALDYLYDLNPADILAMVRPHLKSELEGAGMWPDA